MKAEFMDRSMDLGKFEERFDDDRIICRCEEITKGEIRRAIHEGMMTMPEIRRYLRAGMGLCQGQTCGRLVKQILEAELSGRVKPFAEPTARAPMRPVDMGVYGNEVEQE